MSDAPTPPDPVDPAPQTPGTPPPPGATPPDTPGPTPPGTPGAAPAAPLSEEADIQANKAMAMLAYIIFFIPLIAAKDSPFAKYHANQGLVLTIFGFGAFVVVGILSFMIAFIPFIGWCISSLGCFVSMAVLIAWLVFAVLGIMNASNGLKKPLPLMGNISIIK